MKKAICIAITVAMLLTLSVFVPVTEAAATVVITNTSPAITADVGQTITLSNYSVVFDGDTSATSGVTWKKGAITVTTYKPTAKGVTKLTATSGGKSKTIYVVAKNPADSEYVLFEDDFSSYSSTGDLTSAGYKAISGTIALKDGMLEYGNVSGTYAEGRILLPEWLGDFGDYSFQSEARISTDSNRWFGPVYRISNANGLYYPYYHCCIRQNTTSNGLEFGGRNVNNGWSVMITRSGDVADMTKAFHNLNFSAFQDTFQLKLDGEEIFYTTQEELAAIAASNSSKPWIRIDKGYLGFIASGTTVLVKHIKVVVQENVPSHSSAAVTLVNNDHDAYPLRNAVANVQQVSGTDAYKTAFQASVKPANILVNASQVTDFVDFFDACTENQCIANIKVTSNAQVDTIMTAANTTGFRDITVISSSATVLAYARGLATFIRSGLEVTLPNDEMTSKQAGEIRKAVRGAPATFCVINTSHATTRNVRQLQALALSVWIYADASSENDMIKAVTAGANGIITSSRQALTECINRHFRRNSMTRIPIMIGHRGTPTVNPENSLSSMVYGAQVGADVVEVDVEITKDGEIVIMHDSTIDRTTNGSGAVNSLTLAQLRQYRLYYKQGPKAGQLSDETIPTLREVLTALQGTNTRVFVEFKGSNANNIPTTSAIVKEMDMEDRIDVISFSGTFVSQVQQQANMPGMSTGLLSQLSQGSDPPISVETTGEALSTFYSMMRSSQAVNSTINPWLYVAKANYLTIANDRGFTVWPWTYQYANYNTAVAGNEAGFMAAPAGVTTDDVWWSENMYKFLDAPATVSVMERKSADVDVTATTFANVSSAAEGTIVASVVSGSNVVSVNGSTVTGLKPGTATVIFGCVTKTYNNGEYVVYTQPVTVTVTADPDKPEEPVPELAEGSRYSIDGDRLYIVGVAPETSVESFLANFVNADDLTVVTNAGVDGYIATFAEIECGADTYTVIVKGDVQADGKITATDYLMLKRAVLGTFELDEVRTIAGAISNGTKVIATDYLMVKRHCLGTYQIV